MSCIFMYICPENLQDTELEDFEQSFFPLNKQTVSKVYQSLLFTK